MVHVRALVVENMLSWYESQLWMRGNVEEEKEATRVRLDSLENREGLLELVEHPNVLNLAYANLQKAAAKLQMPPAQPLLLGAR